MNKPKIKKNEEYQETQIQVKTPPQPQTPPQLPPMPKGMRELLNK